MTVSYMPEVANASFFCMFWKVMRIYRGSIYKIVWRELLFFILTFLTTQFIVIFVLTEYQQLVFKEIRDLYYIRRKEIPLHFVLGFFVMLVIERWRFLQQTIPSADMLSILVNSAISSNTERSRLMRRAVVRYVIASYVINLRAISSKMRNRFPTCQSIIDSGILLKNEVEILEKIEKQTLEAAYVVPMVWATNIINRACKEGLINNNCAVQDILTELGNYRNKLGELVSYDLVCIPIFYIQAVTIAICSYFTVSIIAKQVCCEDSVPLLELAISIITASLEFIFHVGWVKVTEVMINPFGEDDEDFEVDAMLDRNLKAANIIVDYMRVKESNCNPYDYPIFNNMPHDNNFNEDPEYCFVQEYVETQTEDEYFQTYENVPVTSAPLQLLTPSQSSPYVDYINVIHNNPPTKEKVVETQTDDKYFQMYENVPVTSAPLQLQTPSQSSSYVDYVNVIIKNPPTVEDGVETQTEDKYFKINENVPVTSEPLQLQTPSQRPPHVDNVNANYKITPTDEEIYSEPVNVTWREANIYENVTPKTKKDFFKRFFFTKFKFNKKN